MWELINLSTGVSAPTDVVTYFLTAQMKGEKAYHEFQENQLEKGNNLVKKLK